MNKKERKSNGEGSIRYCSITKTWIAQISIGRDNEGKLRRKTFRGDTKEEAHKKMVLFQGDIINGKIIKQSETTVSQWLDYFIMEHRNHVKPTTREGYQDIIKKSINPYLGEIKLIDLRPMNIKNMYDSRQKNDNLSSKSIKNISQLLKPALEQAVIEKIITENPAKHVKLPEKEKIQKKYLTSIQQQIFEEAAKDEKYYLAFIFALDTGVRLGELLALTWNDINLNNGSVIINKDLVYVADSGKLTEQEREHILEIINKNLIVQDAPKTDNSIRQIPLSKRLIVLLKEHKLKQQSISNLVFCNKNGSYIYQRTLQKAMHRILKRAGLDKCGLHACRHTLASNLYNNGARDKDVSSILGHADVGFTIQTYVHTNIDNLRDTINLLDSKKVSGLK